MAQIEIDLLAEDVAAFESVFWRFIVAELSDHLEPDVRLDAFRVGRGERRIVTFGDEFVADAFLRHLRLVSPRTSITCRRSRSGI